MPYRAGKGTLFEGGIHGLAFISGELIPESLRGTTSNLFLHAIDWLPTFVKGIAGGSLRETNGLDGMNMWDFILAENTTVWNRTVLYPGIDGSSHRSSVIQSDGWKLVNGTQLSPNSHCHVHLLALVNVHLVDISFQL